MFYRNTWIEVQLDSIRQNLATFRTLGKQIILVVKANAYGHGDVEVCRYAKEHCHIDFFAVSSLDEALHVHHAVAPAHILILGYTDPAHIQTLIANRISATVPSFAYAQQLPDVCDGLRVHIKVDTGMNRLGCRDSEEVKRTIALLERKHCTIEGIFSHYASSDDNTAFSQLQQKRFLSLLDELPHPIPYVHLANTDGALDYPDSRTNAIRVGLGAYGYSTRHELQPALSLFSKIAMVKQVPPHQPISYGCTYTTSTTEWIATLPIGYADGWIRANQGRTAWCNGAYVPFVGRICMDQCMVRLPDELPVGTIVELLGSHSLLQTAADELNTIPYEVLCLLSDRIPRIYYDKEQLVTCCLPRFDKED